MLMLAYWIRACCKIKDGLNICQKYPTTIDPKQIAKNWTIMKIMWKKHHVLCWAVRATQASHFTFPLPLLLSDFAKIQTIQHLSWRLAYSGIFHFSFHFPTKKFFVGSYSMFLLYLVLDFQSSRNKMCSSSF